MKITILTTGGTIDKLYHDQLSEYQVGEPQIAKFLREANVTLDFQVRSLLRKDSLDLTDRDRERIREAVVRDESNHIVVTHGTDTMVAERGQTDPEINLRAAGFDLAAHLPCQAGGA